MRAIDTPAIDTPYGPGASLSGQLEHDPENVETDLSEKIMRNETVTVDT
jgi:hypothetical protein